MPGAARTPDMPRAPVGDIGKHLEAESGKAHLDGGETDHVLWMGICETEDGRTADILPC
jgi:hypothetical protein